MGFVAAVTTCLKKAADFRGRARRSEFWHFIAFWIVVTVASSYAVDLPSGSTASTDYLRAIFRSPVMLVPLVLLMPLAAVAARRLHDVNLSGWWLLTSAAAPIPVMDMFVAGAQVLCFARPGTVGENRFGPDPREAQ